MAGSKGLKRLAFFVVFLIPVGWYLFLQLFGSNKFSLEEPITIPQECVQIAAVSIIYTSDSLSASETNHFNRVAYRSERKNIPLQANSELIECSGSKSRLMLIDEAGIWGTYEITREGVDRLLTELDILIIQKSYGRGTNR